MHRVIDTNVLIVANDRESEQASPECVISCVNWLKRFTEEGILVIDSKWLIINEYKKKVNQSGQLGVGDAFLKWILLNWSNPSLCHFVHINQVSENEFEEFPKSQSLKYFDYNDRKFVAVALTHPERPAIAIAIDRGWNNHHKALSEHDIEIEFLCSRKAKL
jgi:hypothetical protein